MSTVVAALDKQKIPYVIAQDGKSILVSKDTLYKTRMKLMGDGLPLHGGVGLELFNNNEFGTTEFAQRVNYQRALQGELARTIMGFDEVQAARVHLVLPEGNLLRRRGTNAKASVWVTLRGNSALTQEQVNGIQRLVAASVPEIEPTAVTVINHRGVALSSNNQYADGFYVSSANLQIKKEIEAYFSHKVAGVLDEVLGPGNAAVAVDATLDYSQVKTTREIVLPAANKETGVLVRQRERSSGNDPASPASFVHSTAIAAQAPVPAPTSKVLENDYQTGKEIQQIVSAPGTLKRLNVGIVTPQKLPDASIARLQEVIAMAVGLDLARGDAIVFSVIDPLSTPTPSQAGAAAQPTASETLMMSKTQWIAATGAVLIAVLLIPGILFVMRRRRTCTTLSDTERERLLLHIREWLNDEVSSQEVVQHES